MRITIIALNFPPEPVGAGRYTGELARFLVGRGDDLHVITAHPHYPSWRAPNGWWTFRRHTMTDVSGATFRVTRCPTWTPASPGHGSRALHAGLFGFAVLPAALVDALRRPDVVLVIAPTIACVPAGLLTGLASRAKVWLHLQDREIPAAMRLDYYNGSPLARAGNMASAIERLSLRACHGVICISAAMANSIRHHGVTNIHTIPNWVDCTRFCPPSPREVREARRLFSLPDGVPVVLFSGSMGPKQQLEQVIEAASLLRTKPFWFVLCGDGPVKADIQTRARRLPRVRFLDVQPEHRFPTLLHSANIHLVMQHPASEGLLLPSKLGPILASGGHALMCASSGSELAVIAAQSGGRCCPPHDPEVLAASLLRMTPPNKTAPPFSVPSKPAREFADHHLNAEVILPLLYTTLSNF